MPFGTKSIFSLSMNPSITRPRNGSPILVTLVSFWHFAIVRQQILTPSIAFTSIMSKDEPATRLQISHVVLVFSEMKFALSALPETFINMLQVTLYSDSLSWLS